jgi:hypothetical protein
MLENCAFTINSQRKMSISYESKLLNIKYVEKTQYQI